MRKPAVQGTLRCCFDDLEPLIIRLLPFLLLTGLSGCSANVEDLKPQQGQTLDVRGDARRVTITARWAGIDPYPAAEAHCARFGRIPSFGQVEQMTTEFDCVDPAVAR